MIGIIIGGLFSAAAMALYFNERGKHLITQSTLKYYRDKIEYEDDNEVFDARKANQLLIQEIASALNDVSYIKDVNGKLTLFDSDSNEITSKTLVKNVVNDEKFVDGKLYSYSCLYKLYDYKESESGFAVFDKSSDDEVKNIPNSILMGLNQSSKSKQVSSPEVNSFQGSTDGRIIEYSANKLEKDGIVYAHKASSFEQGINQRHSIHAILSSAERKNSIISPSQFCQFEKPVQVSNIKVMIHDSLMDSIKEQSKFNKYKFAIKRDLDQENDWQSTLSISDLRPNSVANESYYTFAAAVGVPSDYVSSRFALTIMFLSANDEETYAAIEVIPRIMVQKTGDKTYNFILY